MAEFIPGVGLEPEPGAAALPIEDEPADEDPAAALDDDPPAAKAPLEIPNVDMSTTTANLVMMTIVTFARYLGGNVF